MKTIDRYLTRELAIPIIYCSFSLVLLILVADLFNNLDDLLRHNTPFMVTLKYYMAIIPFAFTQTISWAAWLGTLFLLVNFGFHNETVAMKAAGMKITSIVKPILFLGFLFGIMTFLINDRVVPRTAKIASELSETKINKKTNKKNLKDMQNVTYYSGKDQLYFFRTFSPKRQEVNGVVTLWLGRTNLNSRQKMIAQRGKWVNDTWEFTNVTEYQMDSRGRILGEPQQFKSKIYPDIKFSPKELEIYSTDHEFLTYRELKGTIEKLTENGVSVFAEKVDLHYRLAAPWQGLVMMLIAIPFLARTTNRRLIAMNVLYCVSFIFLYHVMSAVGLALGKAGKLFPFLSAWMGNILFSLGALFYIEKGNY